MIHTLSNSGRILLPFDSLLKSAAIDYVVICLPAFLFRVFSFTSRYVYGGRISWDVTYFERFCFVVGKCWIRLGAMCFVVGRTVCVHCV